MAQTTTPGTYKYKLQWRDLSIWYGSNDRIPSDLLSHPENWGRYYAGSLAYAAGYLDSADGAILTAIGRQMFDKSTAMTGYIDDVNGNFVAVADATCTDYIGVSPNDQLHIYSEQTSTAWGAWYDRDKNFISGITEFETSFLKNPKRRGEHFCLKRG